MSVLSVKPKSNWTDENGLVHWELVGTIPENPDRVAWDIQYQAECDRLSAKAAARYRHHWGRWYLTGNYLVTKICRASYPGVRGGQHGDCDIELNRCNTARSRENWLEHMDEKNWMGEQGLKDMARAFEGLIKLGLIKG